MQRSDEKYQAYIQILEEELVPAMGCTEPIALAYAAAKAREVLGSIPDKVSIGASGSIIKNVKSVVVPNTGGLHGIEAAAAAGVVAGQSDLLLEVISQVTPEQQAEMRAYLKEHPVRVEFLDGDLVFDIRLTLRKGTDVAKVRIANYHTNIVHMEHNGQVLLDLPVEADDESGLTDRALLSMADIYDFAQTVDIADVKELLDRQIQCNMAISQEGLTHSYGANIGQVIQASSPAGDPIARAKSAAAAGSDARMGGCEMPVIINSGSGNQGITCCVPVVTYAKHLDASEEVMYRSLVVSNLVALLQKRGIGRLSAFCGAVCAACGSGAGITYMHGGDYETIARTITNTLANVSGIVCDGAKGSCAAKIAASVDAAILAHEMSMDGCTFGAGEGLVKDHVEQTIASIGRMASQGMRETDHEILKIMIEQSSGC